MADAGEERRGDEPDRRKDRGRRKKGRLGEKARRARAAQRRRKSQGRRRVNLIVAIAHPLRRRILRVLHDWGEPATPAQIAAELDLPVGAVAYHANVLRRLGAVEPVSEQEERGAVDHLYDSTIDADPPIEALLEETREVDDEDE